MNWIKYTLGLLIGMVVFTSCEEEITVDLPPSSRSIVVEAYINQEFPSLNYVLLSRVVDYFNPNLDLIAVNGASVFITEGEVVNGDTIWDNTSRTNMAELPIPVGNDLVAIYVDPTQQLLGQIGKVYKLEIDVEGQSIYGATSIPDLVPMDSLTFEIKPLTSGEDRAFLSIHFDEPVERGNNYRAMFRDWGDRNDMLTWGDVNFDDIFNDDIVNGVYRNFTYTTDFDIGDTINYYFASMDRVSFNFWESYDAARNNGGPFATPVVLKSNVRGAIGSFSGYAVSFQQLIMKP